MFFLKKNIINKTKNKEKLNKTQIHPYHENVVVHGLLSSDGFDLAPYKFLVLINKKNGNIQMEIFK